MSSNSYGWAQPVPGKGGGGGVTDQYTTDMGMNKNYPSFATPVSFPGGSPYQAPPWTPPPGAPPPGQQPPNPYGGGYPYSSPWSPGVSSGPGMPPASNYPPYSSPTGPGSAQGFLGQWGAGGMGNIGWYGANDKNPAIAASYANNYLIPGFNASLAAQQQAWNEWASGRDFGEQQRVNTGQMDLAYRGSGREDEALRFGQYTNQRDYGEGIRQFDVQAGQGQQQINNNYAIQQAQNKIAQYEASTGRIDVEGRARLGQYQADTEREGVRGSLKNTAFANQTGRMDVKNQYALGQGQLANQGYANETGRLDVKNQYALGQGQNANTRYGLENQFTLGGRQLDFQGRELDVNEAYRRSALSQEADLSREKFQNDLTQSRYSAFGRAQTPNARAARSWY